MQVYGIPHAVAAGNAREQEVTGPLRSQNASDAKNLPSKNARLSHNDKLTDFQSRWRVWT
jgi:hypothetical protein